MQGFRRRSFTTGKELARAIPSHNTVEIELDTYSNNKDTVEFKSVGWSEEFLHSGNVSSGYIRNTRLLELESIDTLLALSNRDVDVTVAKERIMQNELVCEHLYDKSWELIESLDQYTVLAEYKEFEAEQRENSLISSITKRQLLKRGTLDKEPYKKLERLEDKFGTWRIPRYAGFLALNIPVFDPDTSLNERTDTMTDIDIEARFDTIYRTLLDHVDPRPHITRSDSHDPSYRFMKELEAIYRDLLRSLSIETAPPIEKSVTLPLLDTPDQKQPSQTRINQDIRSRPSSQRSIFSDVYNLFSSVGCVILRTSESSPDVYIPNHYVAGEKIGSESNLQELSENGTKAPILTRLSNDPQTDESCSHRRVPNHYTVDGRIGEKTYLEELIETLVAKVLIKQLIGQSFTPTNTGIQCPFCGAYHNPHQAKCIDLLAPEASEGIEAWTSATAWMDYFEKAAAVLDDFVAADVPAEDRLLDYLRS